MKKNKVNYKKFVYSFLIILFFFSCVQFAGAFAEKSIYLGFSLPYMLPEGKDFNGEKLHAFYDYQNNQYYIAIPELEENSGFGFLIGYRSGNFSYEFGYHNYGFNSVLYDPTVNTDELLEDVSRFHALMFNVRIFKSLNKKMELFLILGGSRNYLNVDDSHYIETINPFTEEGSLKVKSDMRLNGYGLNLGGGISFQPVSNLFVVLEAFARPIIFNGGKTEWEDDFGTRRYSNYQFTDFMFGAGVNFNLVYTFKLFD